MTDFDGIVYRIERKTGTGKTMFACNQVNRFFELTTNNYYDESTKKYYSLGLVFATCHFFKKDDINPYFRERDFFYTPIGVLPLGLFDKFNQKYGLKIPILVIFDDFHKNRMVMDTFFKTMTMWKRKYHMEIYFIGHYKKDLEISIRENCDYRIIVDIVNNRDIEGKMYETIEILNENGFPEQYEIAHDFYLENVFDDLKELYDTTEAVKPATPYLIEKEMLKNCKGMTKEQLSDTLGMFIKSKKEFQDKFKFYVNELNIIS